MLIGLGIVIAAMTTVLLFCFGARRMLQPHPQDDTRALATSVLSRNAALHGLVLALVFASEVNEYQQVELESTVEVNAVSDMYCDIDQYGSDTTRFVRDTLRRYTLIVATLEWERLGNTKELSREA